MTRNVTQNTRPSFRFLGEVSGHETKLHYGAKLSGHCIVSYPDPPPERKGGSGEFSTASHHGLAVAEVACWASAGICHISQSECAAEIPRRYKSVLYSSDPPFLLEG